MNTSTDRTHFREVLSGLAAKTLTKIPALNGRTEKACKLVLGGDVELHDDGTALVNSLTDPSRAYLVGHGACDCRDYAQAPEGLCAHRLAVGFARKVRELLPVADRPDAPQRETPAPLPEAPVSMTLKAHLDGHEVLVTLRGVDFASVKSQVEEASAWLKTHAPAHTSSPAQAPAMEAPQCRYHGAMKASTKAPGTWFCTKKLADGSYCPSRFPEK
jgi:hypothetical protein